MQVFNLVIVFLIAILVKLTAGNLKKRNQHASILETIRDTRIDLPDLPDFPDGDRQQPRSMDKRIIVSGKRKKLRQKNYSKNNETDLHLNTNDFDTDNLDKPIKNRRNRKNRRKGATKKDSSRKNGSKRKLNKKRRKVMNSTRHFRSYTKNSVQISELGSGRSITIKTTFDQNRRSTGNVFDMSTAYLTKSDPSERIREAMLDITIRVGSVRSKRRRRNKNLNVSLSLVQPRKDKVPLRLVTKTKSVTLRPPAVLDVKTNRSGRSRSERIEKTFRFEMTRFVPQISDHTKNLTDSKKQSPKLVDLSLPNVLIALSCDVDRRFVPCSKYKVKLTGIQRLRLETVREN